ncbi:putative bifunctional diguanylate cyclase/phosphodiesterase [Legionella norrlandica]|uniref:putative bifunctional diguanylate cyclase/phosphodiesterase n=1 Tax=Legionella norrlandica TaxID=1498499 RepID=UPI00068E6902|nr:bifunctional diguanylate cyclase/phosphodiesterase [Legionella norrlandica]
MFTDHKELSIITSDTQNNRINEIIKAEQIELLYKQLPFGLAGEFIVSIFLCSALWEVTKHNILMSWFMLTCISVLMRSSLVYFFQNNIINLSYKLWLSLFIIGILFTGSTWGYVGGFLIPEKGIAYQSFVVFMVLGVSAAANNLYSPILSVYILFLIISFTPFSIWLFTKGDIYILLGFSSFIYVAILLITAHKANALLLSSLILRFDNNNLDAVTKLLEQKIAERTDKLNQALAVTRSTLESTTDGILVVNLNDKIEFYNQKFLSMWKFDDETIKKLNDKNAIDFVKNQLVEPEKFVSRIQYLYANPDQNSFDELHFKDRRIFERYSMPNRLGNKIIGRVWSFRDVTERKKMELKITHQATHDILTDLPNRTLLNDRIIQAINYSKRFHTNLVVTFIDVDHFKYINDSLGHHAGDIALKEIASRLKNCIRESDTLARFGGDEFVILFLNDKFEEIHSVINKIHNAIGQTITIHNQKLAITVSIGVSIYPRDGRTPSTLLKNADIAMYMAKNNGRNYYHLFDKTMHIKTKREMIIHNYLRNALQKNECTLAFQPILNLKTKKIVAVEALMRWFHPELGEVNPEEFIAIAEKTGLIIQLGEWVLRQACLQIKTWNDKGLPPIRIAVNVSGTQINRKNFIDLIKNILTEFALDPKILEIEITESAIMTNAQHVISSLQELNSLGISISIDDFGTGYSSFSYLKDLPTTKLKIDKSFVKNCAKNNKNASIIGAIITMARQLNLRVLSEGVETIEQENVLIKFNCDEVQGYLYSQAAPPEKIEAMLGH